MTRRTMPLKYVAEIRVSNVDKKSADGERPVRLCNYVDVYKNDVIDGRLDYMRATATADQVRQFRLCKGDIILTKDSETADDIAAAAYVADPLPDLVCGYHLAIVRPHYAAGIHPRFLFWALSSAYFREQMTVAATGVTRFGLRHEVIGSASISLPSLDEQRRIADFLDAESAHIEQVAGRRLHQIERLDERAFATVSERLIPGILDRPMGRWPWEWLPNLDHDRPLVRLGYLCRLQTGLTVDASRNLTRGEVVTRPYVRVANVQAGHFDLEDVADVTVPIEVAVRSTLQPGDVLMTEGGDLDKLGRGTVWCGDVPHCLHQNHIFALRPDPAKLDGRYLAYMTQTLHGRCYFESTGVKTTNLASTNSTKILSFPVPLPALPQQRRLVADVDRSLENIGRARSTLQRQHALLLERRQALITAAVAGHHSAERRGTHDSP